MKKIYLFLNLILLSLLSHGTIYTRSVGQYHSFENVCIGDTLRFEGDSTYTSLYGVVQGWVYNSQTQAYDVFSLTSYFNLQTSYDHIVVAGDSEFFTQGMSGDISEGRIYITCLTSSPLMLEKSRNLNLKVYQSSTEGAVIFECQFSETEKGELVIYNIVGRKHHKFLLNSGLNLNVVSKDNISQGLYIYSLIVNGEQVSAGKFVLTD